MSSSIRIRTTPNSDDKYVKIKLEQDFDLLEILSLKITQEDAYQSFCANYGVVAGRISVNDGFGLPNVKVSIFVPISDDDKDNAIIREIYPYESTVDKNRNGLRYNLLPNRKQHTDHTPVGGFPGKREVLDDETYIEVYEKYYKYTTKTNEAGDFMLFGVPNGQQQLFYDLDVSDIGFLSARPYELIAQGAPESRFQDKFTFKSGSLDQLTQVISETIPIVVKPFWCDTLNIGREIGITRQDIPINYELNPTAIFMGGLFSDDEKDSLNKNCRPRKKMGNMNELITGEGNIEIIRRTQQGDIEFYRDLGDDLIDENGNWSFQVPMNLRKVITEEDGSLIPSPDGIKGVATEADVRFRISMDKSNDDKKLRTRAKMLVPNMLGNYNFDSFDRSELRDAQFAQDAGTGTTIFDINEQTSLTPTAFADDPANEYNYLKEFFTFRWKKVYTVRQYIGRFQPNDNDENRNFIGLKDISDGFGVNKIPFNRIDTNVNPLYTLLCILLSFIGILVALVNGILNLFNGFITMICQIKIPCSVSICVDNCVINRKGRHAMEKRANIYFAGLPGVLVPGALADCNNRITTSGAGNGTFITQSLYCPGQYSPDGSNITCTTGEDFTWGGPWGNCVENVSQTDPSSIGVYDYAGLNNNTNYNPTPAIPNDSFYGPCQQFADKVVSFEYRGWGKDEDEDACENGCPDNCPVNADGKPAININSLNFCRCINIDIKYKCIFGGLLCSSCLPSVPSDPRHGCCGPDNGDHDYGCGQGCDECKDETDDPDANPPCPNSKCKKWSGDKEIPCESINGDPNDNDEDVNGANRCCSDCCVKIPLIKLRCKEEILITPTLFPTPFAPLSCNVNQVIPCPTCGGLELSPIDEWVRCKLEAIAAFLGLIKFDFYNDWLNGSLYFPLIKRKFKTKTRKKKFGQIKKDKFCDFNCYVPEQPPLPINSVDDPYPYPLPPTGNVGIPPVSLQGGKGKYLLSNTADNYGEVPFFLYNTFPIPNPIFLASGTPPPTLPWYYPFLQDGVNNRIYNKIHGKPKYVEYENTDLGFTQFQNIGGHAHHQNICNSSYLVERKEFTKLNMDCYVDTESTPPTPDSGSTEDLDLAPPTQEELGACAKGTCIPGVKGCSAFCACKEKDLGLGYNTMEISHGIIKYEKGNIYYASIIPNKPTADYNGAELNAIYDGPFLKSTLLYPTNITELGSSTFCDIDDQPFLIDKLEPTTFKISEQPGGDKSTINVTTYADFGCNATKCINPKNVVVSSQIGIEVNDVTDQAHELETCESLFDHDEEIRGYFCRRFSTYTDPNHDISYAQPSTINRDNTYETYPEIPDNTPNLLVDLGPMSGDTINDGNGFTSGDLCKMKDGKYIYGINYNTEILKDDPDSINESVEGVSFRTSQTPYYFYFGLIPGKTALHKTVGKFFADKIDEETLAGIDDLNEPNPTQPNGTPQSAGALLKTCLNKS